MIADLESIGAVEKGPSGAVSPVIELGADYMVASSPRLSPPSDLLSPVLSRIESEPARVHTDADGRVVEINPAFSRLCGFSFEEIRGRKPGSLLQGPDTEADCVDTIRQAVKNGVGCETEMYNYHKDGSRYRVHITVKPVRDEEGRLVGFCATEIKL